MKIFETVKNALLDDLPALDNPSAWDLHYYLYIQPEHYIYHADAREAIEELGVWDCIELMEKYAEPFSNPCKVANMIVYLMGGALLQSIYGELGEHTLSAEELEEMRIKAIQWFEERPNGLLDIWKSL